MHWAPIPIAEYALPPPPPDFDVADKVIFRLLSRATRRGFWLSALAFTTFLAIGVVVGLMENTLVGIFFWVLAVLAGTAHILIRDKLNVTLRSCREPATVYWAEPRQLGRHLFRTLGQVNSLTLHTPAPVRLEAILDNDAMVKSGQKNLFDH